MELSQLKKRILKSYKGTQADLKSVIKNIEADKSIFPFNEYEHLMCSLMNKNGLTFEQYLEIRDEYISENPNLWIFEISAPRGFGEGFAQTYIQGKSSKLKKASKKLDPKYTGDYDLWLDGIRIEVKASRVADSDIDAPLYVRALSRNTKKNFTMNFQQLKPQCCDVFIWVAVFRDEIVIWVLNSGTVKNHKLYAEGQHRGNHGNEGQLHVNQGNIAQFKSYELIGDNMEQAIRKAAKKRHQ